MKSFDKVVADIVGWREGGGVGRYVVMCDHKGGAVGGLEEVVKMHEIKDERVRLMINDLVNYFGSLRIEIICNAKTGEADRLELFRIRG
jgi:hypothetical protein